MSDNQSKKKHPKQKSVEKTDNFLVSEFKVIEGAVMGGGIITYIVLGALAFGIYYYFIRTPTQ